jgi:hypothetical protein
MSQNLTLFKARVPSCSFVTSSGIIVVFSGGKYATGNAKIIEELKAEIEAGSPLFYLDPAESLVAAHKVEDVKRVVESTVKGMASTSEINKGSAKNSVSSLESLTAPTATSAEKK